MSDLIHNLLADLPQCQAQLRQLREVVLANALLIGEIPAPTFEEEARRHFLNNRFTECGLANAAEDTAGNALASIPGVEGERNILVLAHMDTVFTSGVDHAMSVGPDSISGPGIADNSLGLAVLASLPTILDRLGLTFRSNIIVMGASRSLGHGNLGGIRSFLKYNQEPIDAAICVEGAQLGRLSYSSIGMLRAEITVEIPEQTDYAQIRSFGAIAILNKVINRILAIPLPSEPRSHIILGSVSSGTAFNTLPRLATLRFEVRSEQEDMATRLGDAIREICAEIAAEHRVKVRLNEVARRKVGGIGYSHPLVKAVRAIMEHLGINAKIAPSTGELSALIDMGIPAVTLGITRAENLHEFDEAIAIEPLFTGLAQLIATLKAIDQGILHEQ